MNIHCVLTILLGFTSLLTSSKGQSCQYRYTIQPAPGNYSCNISRTEYIEFLCQVTSNGSRNFSITWHFSTSLPNLTFASTLYRNIYQGDNFAIKTEGAGTNKTSCLSVSLRNQEDIHGYYWCSINDGSSWTYNPHRLIHIEPQMPCSTDEEECSKEVCSIQPHSQDISQCEIGTDSLNTADAQTCYEDEKIIQITTESVMKDITEQPKTALTMDTDNSSVEHTTNSTSASHITIYVIIGATIGSFITAVLLFAICCVCLCLVVIKHKQRRRRPTIDCDLSAFNDIRMSTMMKKLEDENDDFKRASKMSCEANVCYEPSTNARVTRFIENIYEYLF